MKYRPYEVLEKLWASTQLSMLEPFQINENAHTLTETVRLIRSQPVTTWTINKLPRPHWRLTSKLVSDGKVMQWLSRAFKSLYTHVLRRKRCGKQKQTSQYTWHSYCPTPAG